MSWASRCRALSAVMLAAVLAVVAGACQVRPLYAPGPTGVSVAQVLPTIDLAPPQTRPEQVFHNSLLFRLRGGGESGSASYQMTYQLRVGETQLAIERVTGTPAAYEVRGTVLFAVQDGTTGRTVLRDQIRATASYDRSTQEFANVRARQDAEERIANTLADSVAIRLASHFAAQ